MTTTAMFFATPKYVLLDKMKQRFGPGVIASPAGLKCHAIYAFSDKARFDRFCHDSELALTPYPLVQGYLRNQIDDPLEKTDANGGPARQKVLHLVVLDPSGPDADSFQAATMEAVLEALENQSKQVTPSHTLSLDSTAGGYRLQETAIQV